MHSFELKAAARLLSIGNVLAEIRSATPGTTIEPGDHCDGRRIASGTPGPQYVSELPDAGHWIEPTLSPLLTFRISAGLSAR
jgi:hypothetical protein